MPDTKPSLNVKLFGTEAAGPQPRTLTAGNLTAQLDNGAIRRILYHGAEVLRGIAYLPRDKNWGTYAPAITDLVIDQQSDRFRVSYAATFADHEQSLRAEAVIEGRSDGTLSFSVTAVPGANFITNRTGFVVLHPLHGVVGAPVEVVHVDGSTEQRAFPELISPGQPIIDIRSLAHQVMPGVRATVLMQGDKFEMEDHRNWMDASYKTYVRSLLDPWPYSLPAGSAFIQSVSLSLDGAPSSRPGKRLDSAIAVTVGGDAGRMPALGSAVSMDDAKSSLASVGLIASAKPSCLICQIDGRRDGQVEAAATYREIAAQTGIPVTLEIILPAQESADAEMARIAEIAQSCGLQPSTVVVTQAHDLKSFQPGASRPWGPSYPEMAAAARRAFPGTLIGGGMLSFFTELNRKRPPTDLFDFITHSTCPIVHAADDLSVMETLEALPWIIRSTRAMIGTAPYHLGPSGIACRDNPYGSTTFANPANGRLCLTDNDPRQRGLFAAAWNLGLISAEAYGGIDAVALGSATGPRGMIRQSADDPQPGFDGGKAAVFPLYHVFAGLSPMRGFPLLAAEIGSPPDIAALALRSGPETVLWLANLADRTQAVRVNGLSGPDRLTLIDDESFGSAQKPDFLSVAERPSKGLAELILPPYAVARIVSSGQT